MLGPKLSSAAGSNRCFRHRQSVQLRSNGVRDNGYWFASLIQAGRLKDCELYVEHIWGLIGLMFEKHRKRLLDSG